MWNAIAIVAVVALVLVIVYATQDRARDGGNHHQENVTACLRRLSPQDRTAPVVAHCRTHPSDAVSRGEP